MRALDRDFTRGEIIHAYVWLSVFAAISAVVEGTYLLTLWAPLAWAATFFGNVVLTRTAALWTHRTVLRLIPLAVWCVVWCTVWSAVWLFTAPVARPEPANPAFAVMAVGAVAGLAGGLWPLTRAK